MSEDIDLVLDWGVLGYGSGREDPYPQFTSGTKKSNFNNAMDTQAASYIIGTLLPKLRRLFTPYDGVLAKMAPNDPHTINIAYPVEFKHSKLRPEILLEIGPRASWLPSSVHEIRPYAADMFPALFIEPACEVVAIDLVRIFWEKATILHQQAHRPKPITERYSRHYYDLYKLARSEVGHYAAGDIETLAQVVEFKNRFYPSNSAQYETAVPGSLRLLPLKEHLGALRRDYADMEEMIFGEVPAFDEILEGLRDLEQTINRERTARP